MAAKYTINWLYAARTAPLFAKRFKSILVHFTNWTRNVKVSSSPLAYHGYVEYAGGTLARGYDRAEDIADFVQSRFITKKPPAQFAVYFQGQFTVPKGGVKVSGTPDKTWAKVPDTVESYTASSRLTRGGQSFAAGIDAWLNRHRDADATLVSFRVNFVSTAIKASAPSAAPSKTPQKPKTRNSAGRRNGRIQRSSAVRVRSGKRRTEVSRADNRGISTGGKKKKTAKRHKR